MPAKGNKIVFGFDLDGVIIDHTRPKIRLAKKMGFNLKPEQTYSDNFNEHLPEEARKNLQEILYNHPEVAASSPLMKGVEKVLSQIKKKKWPFFIISRRENVAMVTRLLQKRQLWPKYFNEQNSFFVLTPEDKEIRAAKLGVTHYVDDEVRVLDKLKSVKNKFQFDPFRISNSKYPKINSWDDFLKELPKEDGDK